MRWVAFVSPFFSLFLFMILYDSSITKFNHNININRAILCFMTLFFFHNCVSRARILIVFFLEARVIKKINFNLTNITHLTITQSLATSQTDIFPHWSLWQAFLLYCLKRSFCVTVALKFMNLLKQSVTVLQVRFSSWVA